MGINNYISTYQNDFSGNTALLGVGLRPRQPGSSGRRASHSGVSSKPMNWNNQSRPTTSNNYLDSGSKPSNMYSSQSHLPSASMGGGSYQKYSPADWSSSNISHYNSADASRNQSERIRNEAVRLIREREDKTITTQRDADRRIGERLHDETHWRSELAQELEKNTNETHHLQSTRKSLERALAETEGPMRVNSECLYNREGRKGIDMVKDNVENSLHREVDNIRVCQDKMKRTLEQVNHQIGVNRNTRHGLERDISNKDHGINIDHTVHNLHNQSRNINLHGGIERVDPSITIPDTWAEFSNNNMQKSQGARSQSQRLRGTVDGLVTSCANDMWSHWNQSNRNFQQRITETTDTHNKLQSHLSKTMQEIYDQEKHMDGLRQSIRAKGNPLKVAQTRLEMRTHRPDVELCRDPPHHRLVEEVGTIQESIGLLNNKLGDAEQAHQNLLMNKSRLEHDIKIKSNSLFIDREKCLSNRKSFPVVSLATKL